MARNDYVTKYAVAAERAGDELFRRVNAGQAPSTIAKWLTATFPSLSGQIIGAMIANAPRQIEAEKRAFAEGRIPAVTGRALEVKADLPRAYRYYTETSTTDPASLRVARVIHVFDRASPLSSDELRAASMAENDLLRPSFDVRYTQEISPNMAFPVEYRVLRVQEQGPLPAA